MFKFKLDSHDRLSLYSKHLKPVAREMIPLNTEGIIVIDKAVNREDKRSRR
jgi:hypothetical protein